MNEGAKREFILNILYYGLATLICFGLLRFVLPWFWPFLGGLGLAYLFKHLSDRAVRLLPVRGRVTVVVIALLFYASVVLLFWTLTAVSAGQLVEAARWFPRFYRENLLPAADQLGGHLVGALEALAPAFAMSVGELLDLLSSAMGDLVSGLSTSLLAAITGQLKRLPLFLIGFVFMIVSSFYIGMDYRRVTGFLMRQVPRRFRSLILEIKDFLVSCLGRVIRAYLIIMLVTSAELALGLWALRVEGFWKIALLIAVLDILPIIGSGSVLVPWGVYHLAGGNAPLGIGLLILYGVIAVVRNIVEPRIVGDQLGLHPVVTLSAMYFGLRVLGFAGIFIAPVAALLIRYLNEKGRMRLYR